MFDSWFCVPSPQIICGAFFALFVDSFHSNWSKIPVRSNYLSFRLISGAFVVKSPIP